MILTFLIIVLLANMSLAFLQIMSEKGDKFWIIIHFTVCLLLCLSVGRHIGYWKTVNHFEEKGVITEFKWEDGEKYYLIGDKWVDGDLKVKEDEE